MDKINKVLSIIIPLFNEEKTIGLILEEIIAVPLIENIEKEIIIIDDYSSDSSESEVRKILRKYPDMIIKYKKHSANCGKGRAIRTGIELVTGNFVIIQDADLEYSPEDYNPLIQYLLQSGDKVVYGSRFLNKENKHSYLSFYLGGRLVSVLTNILYRQKLTDEPTCYKMFDAATLKSLKLECTGFEFCPEVTAKMALIGARIKELPIRYYPRSIHEGKKIKWHDGVMAIWTLVKYRF